MQLFKPQASQRTLTPLEIKHKSGYVFQSWKTTSLRIDILSRFWRYTWQKKWEVGLGKLVYLIHPQQPHSSNALSRRSAEMSGNSNRRLQGSSTWYMMLNLSDSFHFAYSNALTSVWIQMLSQNPSPGEVWRESEISLKVCRGLLFPVRN